MSDILDYYLQPYAEDDLLCNTFLDNIANHTKFRLWENQEDWIYMAGELGKGMPPKFKPNALQTIQNTVIEELGFVIDYLTLRLITEYRISNIDLDENTIEELKWSMEEDEYEEWEQDARDRIFKDYAEYMGEEKAKAYFAEIWKD